MLIYETAIFNNPKDAFDFKERLKNERVWDTVYAVALAALAYGAYWGIQNFTLPAITLAVPALLCIGAIIYMWGIIFAEGTVKKQIKADALAQYEDCCSGLDGKQELQYTDTEDKLSVTLDSRFYAPEAFTKFLAFIKTKPTISSLKFVLSDDAVVPAQFFVDLLAELPGKKLEQFKVPLCLVAGFYDTLSVASPNNSIFPKEDLTAYEPDNRAIQSWVDELHKNLLPLLRDEQLQVVSFGGLGKYCENGEPKFSSLPRSETFEELKQAITDKPNRNIWLFGKRAETQEDGVHLY